MSSGVISITDAMYERMLGREASDELVRAKARSRPRQPLPLEQELAIRAARVEELQRGAHSPVGEWPNVGRWTKPRPTPPRSTTTPAWSKPRPSQPREEYPWSVTLHKRATRPFRINLLGDVSRHMLAEMADAMPDGLETGGLLLSWSRPSGTSRKEIVYASGAASRGSSRATLDDAPA